MMYIATVQAFDAITEVHAHLSVRAYGDDPEAPSSIAFECTTTFPGIGETDPRMWAEDFLIALLEEM